MDDPALAQCFGIFRLQQDLTPRQRRLTVRITAGVLGALAAWFAVRIVQDGFTAALPVALYIVLSAAAGLISDAVDRRMGPMTRISAEGLAVGTGLTGGRQVLEWSSVLGIDFPRRFESYSVAIMSSGARVELPGVPPGVLERLGAELAERHGRPTPPVPRPEPPHPDGDRGWDGPFQRG